MLTSSLIVLAGAFAGGFVSGFGGLAGVPFGAWLLPFVPLQGFKAFVGVLLVGYCAFNLYGRSKLRVNGGGRVADTLIGFGGGILGGRAGMSGPLPTIWSVLRGWDKDTKRAIFQAFNTAIPCWWC